MLKRLCKVIETKLRNKQIYTSLLASSQIIA